MKILFYYVRHGQTLFNKTRRLQGGCDSPLTEKGIEEAHRAEQALRSIPFTHAFTSSSERAVDTAGIILERHNVQAIRMKGLKEFDFGKLDGAGLEDPAIKSEVEQRMQSGYQFQDIGGESLHMFYTRMIRTFEIITQMCRDGERVLIVSHGCYGLQLMERLLNMKIRQLQSAHRDMKAFPFPNGGIMQFVYEAGKWSLLQEPIAPQLFHDRA